MESIICRALCGEPCMGSTAWGALYGEHCMGNTVWEVLYGERYMRSILWRTLHGEYLSGEHSLGSIMMTLVLLEYEPYDNIMFSKSE